MIENPSPSPKNTQKTFNFRFNQSQYDYYKNLRKQYAYTPISGSSINESPISNRQIRKLENLKTVDITIEKQNQNNRNSTNSIRSRATSRRASTDNSFYSCASNLVGRGFSSQNTLKPSNSVESKLSELTLIEKKAAAENINLEIFCRISRTNSTSSLKSQLSGEEKKHHHHHLSANVLEQGRKDFEKAKETEILISDQTLLKNEQKYKQIVSLEKNAEKRSRNCSKSSNSSLKSNESESQKYLRQVNEILDSMIQKPPRPTGIDISKKYSEIQNPPKITINTRGLDMSALADNTKTVSNDNNNKTEIKMETDKNTTRTEINPTNISSKPPTVKNASIKSILKQPLKSKMRKNPINSPHIRTTAYDNIFQRFEQKNNNNLEFKKDESEVNDRSLSRAEIGNFQHLQSLKAKHSNNLNQLSYYQRSMGGGTNSTYEGTSSILNTSNYNKPPEMKEFVETEANLKPSEVSKIQNIRKIDCAKSELITKKPLAKTLSIDRNRFGGSINQQHDQKKSLSSLHSLPEESYDIPNKLPKLPDNHNRNQNDNSTNNPNNSRIDQIIQESEKEASNEKIYHELPRKSNSNSNNTVERFYYTNSNTNSNSMSISDNQRFYSNLKNNSLKINKILDRRVSAIDEFSQRFETTLEEENSGMTNNARSHKEEEKEKSLEQGKAQNNRLRSEDSAISKYKEGSFYDNIGGSKPQISIGQLKLDLSIDEVSNRIVSFLLIFFLFPSNLF